MRRFSENLHLKKCRLCGKTAIDLSEKLGVCKECLLQRNDEAMQIVSEIRKDRRKRYSLPFEPPKTKGGLACGRCVNNCLLGEGEIGFCNLVKNEQGTIVRKGDEKVGGLFSFYYDFLPTNCVAAPFCPGCSSIGYPKYSYNDGPEYGRNNLAVFYQACTFDCLFCQNYQYRLEIHHSSPRPPKTLIAAVKDNTSCICFFGGDPAAQIAHSNAVGELAIEKARKENRIIRVCWETNGSAHPKFLRKSAEIALESGGCVKVDIKTFDDELNLALCGSSNKFTLRNVKAIGELHKERPAPPLLVASTLLIPGYIDVDQVSKIAELLVSIDPTIPYSLLGFYPAFVIDDLPTTSREQADRCFKAAKEKGLENVSIGNKHLLR